MALVKPPLATVEPGRPITAQGWNAIVDALSALYDAVLAFGSGSVTVSVQSDGQPVPGAQVVAEPVERTGQPVDGLPLFGTRDTYLVTGVSDGAWRVFVSAPGYVSQTIDVTVPAAAPVTVNLVLAGKVVPDLFDQPLQGALAALSTAGHRRRPHRRRAGPGDLADAGPGRVAELARARPVPRARQRRRPGHDPHAPRRRRRAARGADRHRPEPHRPHPGRGGDRAARRSACGSGRSPSAADATTRSAMSDSSSAATSTPHQHPGGRAHQRRGAAAAAPRASTVFVDVAQAPTRADISRGGFALGEIARQPGPRSRRSSTTCTSSRRRSSASRCCPGPPSRAARRSTSCSRTRATSPST